MSEEKLSFSLEEKLREDDTGELKREIERQLNDQITEIDGCIKDGVSPDQYTELNQVRIGLQSALTVLEKVWQQFHKDTS
ncbi:MAG: hypothetical protein GDA45_00125 [Chromatiales bacterium]|nr:hypothetical protein [Chromatiales bacterium]